MADSATAAVAELFAAADLPPEPAPAGDAEVERRLADLDELLARVEELPGPAGELAMEAVAAVAEIYGAALTRAMTYVSAAPPLVEAFTGDDLLGHLLVLHGIHPDPAEQRIARALDEARAALGPSGAEVALLGLRDGIAEIRLPAEGHGCGSGCGCSSSGGASDVVRDAVLAAAPELAEVRLVTVEVPPPAAFVPLDALHRRAVR